MKKQSSMANDSGVKSSSKGFFLNRSILWKIIFVFLLILSLLLFQFAVIFGSITNIGNESDDAFNQIKTKNDENRILVDLSDAAVRLQAQLEFIKGLYIGYRVNTVENASVTYDEITDSIVPLESPQGITNFIRSKLKTLDDDFSKELGAKSAAEQFLITDRNLDSFESNLESIFRNMPSHIGEKASAGFAEFNEVVNFKISNLLKWMYSNNNATLLGMVQAENTAQSSYILSLNQTLLEIDKVDKPFYNQISPSLDFINQAYLSLFVQIDLIVAEVTNASFDPNSFDQTEINNRIDALFVIAEEINAIQLSATDIISTEETIINTLYTDIEILFSSIGVDLIELLDWSSTNQVAIESDLTSIRDSSSNRIADLISTITVVLIIIFLFSVVFILSLIVVANFQISKPIKHISYWSEKISNQDLSYSDYKSNRKDEIGVLHNNFRLMNKNLQDIIIEVKGSSTIVSETANELLSNTEEINATAEEVSAIAQSMAKGSTQQAELIATIVEELQVTSDTVDRVINQINYNLRIIHELSEQTNILALNTAIEAANAGEFGRGFAVISDNIRKMASQSKKTTEEVTKDSRDVLLKLQNTFSNITGKIENVAAVSEETAASAEEVAASAEELTAVMETVSAKSSILDERSSQSESLVKNFILEKATDPKLESKSNGESQAKDI